MAALPDALQALVRTVESAAGSYDVGLINSANVALGNLFVACEADDAQGSFSVPCEALLRAGGSSVLLKPFVRTLRERAEAAALKSC